MKLGESRGANWSPVGSAQQNQSSVRPGRWTCGAATSGHGSRPSDRQATALIWRERRLLFRQRRDLRLGARPSASPRDASSRSSRQRRMRPSESSLAHRLDQRRISRNEQAQTKLHRRRHIDESPRLDETQQVEEVLSRSPGRERQPGRGGWRFRRAPSVRVRGRGRTPHVPCRGFRAADRRSTRTPT